MTTCTLDEALERLHRTGPEFDGWLSNHGPMAADALGRMGRGDGVAAWVTGYERRLEAPPEPRWPIDPLQWREPLGDASRLGDWCELLLREVREEPWSLVLQRWWPRLLPGALAAATHGLIRTGHAVRSLREEVTGPRLDELALALAYWAGRWQPVPDASAQGPRQREVRSQGASSAGPAGAAPDRDRVLAALDGLPVVADEGGIRTRAAAVSRELGWARSRHALAAPDDAGQVPAALDRVVDAAVTRYRDWAHGQPVMLVHAATAPRAVGLVLPSLPVELWRQSFDTAWAVTATIGSAYRPAGRGGPAPVAAGSLAQAQEACVATADEHAIKFAEVAGESAARGSADAVAAATRAAALIGG